MAQHTHFAAGTLTADRLDRLLQSLDGDREVAAERYAWLVRRLVAYFGWQRCADAERLADEVMDRVARRLSEGEPVANVPAYAVGVARLVTREVQARWVREQRLARDFGRLVPRETEADETALVCLDGCLQRLTPDRRRELLDYYGADVGGRIEGRRRQAAMLGISPLALRNRMLRLRQGLETCVTRCLGRARDRDAGGVIGGRPPEERP